MMRPNGVHWLTESLGQFCGRLARSSPPMARKMTLAITQEMCDRIKQRTPVAKHPNGYDIPGKLRASIHVAEEEEALQLFARFAEVSGLSRVHEAHVETDVSYAPDVEYDTGQYHEGHPYLIAPLFGKALAFRGSDGRWYVVAHVIHPGSKGVHMFARGAASMTEATIRRVAEKTLIEWGKDFKVARPPH